jgi:hypothetical protein
VPGSEQRISPSQWFQLSTRNRPEAALTVRLSKIQYYLVDNIYVSYIIAVDRLGSRTKWLGRGPVPNWKSAVPGLGRKRRDGGPLGGRGNPAQASLDGAPSGVK